MSRTTTMRALAAAAVLTASAALASAPAAADCVRVAVSYTSPNGAVTPVSRPCAASTPWNETFYVDQRTWNTDAGYVRVQAGIPAP